MWRAGTGVGLEAAPRIELGYTALQDGSSRALMVVRGHVFGTQKHCGNTQGTFERYPAVHFGIEWFRQEGRSSPRRPVANEGENSARLWCWR